MDQRRPLALGGLQVLVAQLIASPSASRIVGAPTMRTGRQRSTTIRRITVSC